MFGWFKSKKQDSTTGDNKPEELLGQCQQWYEQKQYENIIESLKDLPEQTRSPDLDFILAKAYLKIAKQSDQPDQQKIKQALSYLIPHREFFAENAVWHAVVGNCFFELDLTYLAYPYFGKAIELNPNDKQSAGLMFGCSLDLAGPLFKNTKNLLDRAETMWQSFGGIEAAWRQDCATNGVSVELFENIKTNCDQIFAPFNVGCYVKQSPDGTFNFILTFNVSSQLNLLFPLKFLVKNAPEAIKQHWQIQMGFEPIDTPFVKRDDLTIASKDLLVKLIPAQTNYQDFGFEQNSEQELTPLQPLNSKFILAAYHPDMAELKNVAETSQSEEALAQLENFYGACIDLIRQNIGEIASCHAFESIGMVPALNDFDNIKEDAVPVEQLPQKLMDLGYNLKLTLPELQEARRFDYTRNAEIASEPRVRQDIFKGYSFSRELLFEFEEQDTSLINQLHTVGTSAGFLAYIPKNQNSGTDISTERQELQDKIKDIVSSKHDKGFEVIGAAFGSKYDYIDVFCCGFYPDLFADLCNFIAENQDNFEDFQYFSFRPGFYINFLEMV